MKRAFFDKEYSFFSFYSFDHIFIDNNKYKKINEIFSTVYLTIAFLFNGLNFQKYRNCYTQLKKKVNSLSIK
jgi:hypothetical protein